MSIDYFSGMKPTVEKPGQCTESQKSQTPIADHEEPPLAVQPFSQVQGQSNRQERSAANKMPSKLPAD